jgi:hypothetical protein
MVQSSRRERGRCRNRQKEGSELDKKKTRGGRDKNEQEMYQPRIPPKVNRLTAFVVQAVDASSRLSNIALSKVSIKVVNQPTKMMHVQSLVFSFSHSIP